MSNLFEKIGGGIAALGLAIGGFFGYVPEPAYEAPVEYVDDENLGADSVLPIAGMTYYLSGTGMTSTASSFKLTSFTIPQNGTPITDSMLSTTFYITLEPGSRTRQEIISCTTVTQNVDGTATISGCTRGLSPVTPYTASSSLQFAHAGGSIAIFSNPPQLYNQVAIKDNDETITGSWLFNTPVAGANPATKDYVTSVITGGTISYDRIVVAGVAGETVATGTIVYLNNTNSRWYKADNDLPATYVDQVLGISQGNGTAGVSIDGGVLTYGLDSSLTGLTSGNFVWLSGTAGATSTATTSQVLGKAISATTMFFDPNLIDSTVYTATTFTATTTFTGPTIGFGTASVTVFTTVGTSTFTKNANAKYATIEGVGGGGGGGYAFDSDGNDTEGGGAGGSGAYFKKYMSVSSLGATEMVTIGAAGIGGTVGTGGTGGTTLFGAHATATGGVGGSGSGSQYSPGGSGGTATGGDINLGGNYGDNGNSDQGDNGSQDCEPGTTTNSFLGNYGQGGGGGCDGNGAAGTSGIVIITEYF